MDSRTLIAAGATIAAIGAGAVALYNSLRDEPASDVADEKLQPEEATSGHSSSSIIFAVNGERHEVANPDPGLTLSHFLRRELCLTGTKLACGEGGCGACAVLLQWADPDGQVKTATVNACLRPLVACDGMSITTTEGLGSQRSGFHPVQERIAKFNGSQCGFCTPGMVMAVYGALRRGGAVCASDMEAALDGNICRCTGYRPILDAAKSFAPDGGVVDHVTAGAAPVGPFALDSARDPTFPAFLSKQRGRQELRVEASGHVWVRPTDLHEALRLLHHPAARAVVANTATGIYKEGTARIQVDVSCLSELRGVRESATGLTVGAAESIATLISHLEARKAGADVCRRAASHLNKIASHHVRNVGSIGGNIAMARVHAFESDLVTVLLGLGASVTVATEEGTQAQDLLAFLQEGPTARGLITSVFIPTPADDDLFRSHKVALRPQNSHALVNASFLFSTSGGTIRGARVVYGGVGGPHAVRLAALESALVGKSLPLPDAAISQLADIAAREITVPRHSARAAYRQRLVRNLLVKTLREISGDATAAAVPRAMSGGCQASGISEAAAAEHAPVGKAIPKLGADLQASGEAQYTDDEELPRGALSAAFVLSTVARAKVISIDASAALRCPGVVRFLTAKDVPGKNDVGTFGSTEELFATVSQFAGQPVGLIVADTQAHAAAAAKEVKVTYESHDGAPVLTAAQAKERGSMFGFMRQELSRGDVDTAFEAAEDKLTGDAHGNTQQHFYLEPMTAWARPAEDNGLDLGVSSQWPAGTQAVAAKVAGIDANKVSVRMRRAGGAFGAKVTRQMPVAGAAAVAARVLQRPVRMALDRNTDMIITGGRHDVDFSYKVGCDANGNISSLDIHIVLNGGFSMDASMFVAMFLPRSVEQAYYVPNYRVVVEVAQTNLPTRTAMRGPGEIQSSFVAEAVMSHVAMHVHARRGPSAVPLAIVAQDIRTRNMFPADDESKMVTVGNDKLTHYTLPRLWAELRASSKFDERAAAVEAFNRTNKHRKRGMAMTPVKYFVRANQMEALVQVYEDGTVRVLHGGSEIGQGIHTKVVQAAAFYLSALTGEPFPMENIRVHDSDTRILANMGFTGGSTTTEAAVEAMRLAIEDLVSRLRPVRDGIIAKRMAGATPNTTPPTFAEIAAACLGMGGPGVSLTAQASYRPKSEGDSSHAYFNYGAAVSEIEVDVLTGETTILRSDVLYDCGKSLNPAIDLGQAEGAFMQGVGYFLREDVVLDPSGRVASNGTWEYKPPCSADIPVQFNVAFLKDSPFPKGILSSKAVGEPPLVLATSVYCALQHAVAAARADKGLNGPFRLDAPATVDVIQAACDGVAL